MAGTDGSDTPASKFSGLTGQWKNIANFGIIGVVAYLMVHMVLFTFPEMQKAHLSTIKETQDSTRKEIQEERAAARVDSEKSREHGTRSAEKMAMSIDSLNNTFREVQAETQANQRRMIELQIKKMEQDSRP